jgi:hypothetical protein
VVSTPPRAFCSRLDRFCTKFNSTASIASAASIDGVVAFARDSDSEALGFELSDNVSVGRLFAGVVAGSAARTSFPRTKTGQNWNFRMHARRDRDVLGLASPVGSIRALRAYSQSDWFPPAPNGCLWMVDIRFLDHFLSQKRPSHDSLTGFVFDPSNPAPRASFLNHRTGDDSIVASGFR